VCEVIEQVNLTSKMPRASSGLEVDDGQLWWRERQSSHSFYVKHVCHGSPCRR